MASLSKWWCTSFFPGTQLTAGALRTWLFSEENPNQTYQELLRSIRAILKKKYSQNPQLSSSHRIVGVLFRPVLPGIPLTSFALGHEPEVSILTRSLSPRSPQALNE